MLGREGLRPGLGVSGEEKSLTKKLKDKRVTYPTRKKTWGKMDNA